MHQGGTCPATPTPTMARGLVPPHLRYADGILHTLLAPRQGRPGAGHPPGGLIWLTEAHGMARGVGRNVDGTLGTGQARPGQARPVAQ